MAISVLNEVLSLNAQESAMARWIIAGPPILNEVLSLNAQESHSFVRMHFVCSLLNEVLSLNAQESHLPQLGGVNPRTPQ